MTTTATATDVLVLGAGPAGCAAAIGLRQHGISVRVLSRSRTDGIEGVSARTVQQLRAAGLEEAAAACGETAPRVAYWAGERIGGGAESLVRRAQLDEALVRDLALAQVAMLPATVRDVRAAPTGFRVSTDCGEFRTACVIDARGRRVRRADELGPRLVAWTDTYQPRGALAPGSALVAVDRGWSWIACTGEGAQRRVQILYVGAARRAPAPRSECLAAAAAVHAPALRDALAGARRVTTSVGCAAVARFSWPARTAGWLRIGDAAVALDPLSGHGIFEALRSARVAVAAMHSHLIGLAWEPIARFVNEHASTVWQRVLMSAAESYGRQAARSVAPFWRTTATDYAALAATAGPRYAGPRRIERRPVLNGSRIELRDVWVSREYPRGVWLMNGRDGRRSPGEGVGKTC